MDRERFSFVAHREHAFCNPVGEAKITRVIDRLALTGGDRVVDFGAGKCELLIRLVERYGVRADAVDTSRLFLDEGRRRARGRIDDAALAIHVQEAQAFLAGGVREAYAAALCVGSTHALGGHVSSLTAMASVVRPGGSLLVGEGYWKRRPEAGYLELLGGDESEFVSHAENVERGRSLGLVPMWASTASEDEWDEYEWLYSSSIERFVAEHPDDPDAEAMLARIRPWRAGYLRWGRDTLGFGLYLFMKPHVAE